MCIFSYSTVFAAIKKTEIGTRSGETVSQSAFSTANTTYIINNDIKYRMGDELNAEE